LVALLSIFGTLGVVGLIGGAWLWLGNNQTSNQVPSNSSINTNQISPTVAKSNISSRSNQTENSKPDKKPSNSANNANNSNTTIPTTNKTENSPINASPTLTENSTALVQVRLTNLGKTGNSPYPDGSITIQAGNKSLTAITNNAGIVSFKDVSCDKQVRITIKSEDGSGTFTRNLKCGANASWSYQVDCFVSGKNGGCAVEQVK
jgi:cytoskeletal protein RodZ